MILVTGATGFLGKNVCKLLEIKKTDYVKTSLSLGVDLRNQNETEQLFESIRPSHVINCAAFVGGIQFGYKHPAEIFRNNLEMTIHLLDACHQYGVQRIVNPISNCVYPAKATLFREEEIWDGPLHESVLVYGFVRKAFWVGSWAHNKQYDMDIVNLVLSNMYGPEDHFEEERSHALGALIMKFVKAKLNNEPFVTVWGSGQPVREWLYVEDGAEALIRALKIDPYIEPINVGIASGISIMDLALMIKDYVGYAGDVRFDHSKPDGALYKTVDGSRGQQVLGWRPSMDLKVGVRETIDWYIKTLKMGKSS